jgi:hypothetical protein
MLIVPVPNPFIPNELFPEPPVTFPVTFIIPEPEFTIAEAVPPAPAVTFPVMLIVPELLLLRAYAELTDPPVKFPTIYPTAGEAAVNCRQLREAVADLLVTFAVSVTPSLSVKRPVPALDTSSQVTLAVMVTVWPVLARASSPTPGTTPPTHVAPALKLPVAAEVMRAMA